MPIRFEDSTPVKPFDDRDTIGITPDDLKILLSGFGRIGFWRLDIDNSAFELSKGGYEVYGLPFVETRASLLDFRKRLHPDDVELVAEAISTASERKCGFAVIYRLNSDGMDKYVRTIGAHRAIAGTSGELYGVTYELLNHVREVVFTP